MSQKSSQSFTPALILIGILFFTFGYITWTNGALIPILKILCNLKTDVQAFLVTFAFYMAYTFLALPSSAILRKTGFKGGMILGLVIVAVGSLIFIPAAQTRTYGLFLTGLFIQAIGLTILQTAVNPYVSILGPIESAAKRISIMGIFNKGAGIIAPLILGFIVLADANDVEHRLDSFTDTVSKDAYLNELASRMILPYVVLAIVLIVVALLIWRSNLPDLDDPDENPDSLEQIGHSSVFKHRNLVLGIFAIFFYVGAEVIAGDAIGQFGRNLGISLQESKIFTSYTLTAMLAGYVIGIATIPKYLTQEKALTYSALLGLALTGASFFATGYTSIYLMAAMGLANALMWPAIFPMAIKGLGKFTKIGSALLIMGVSGGAILPLIFAKTSSIEKPQQGFWVMAICYLFVLFYAVYGHKVESGKIQKDA